MWMRVIVWASVPGIFLFFLLFVIGDERNYSSMRSVGIYGVLACASALLACWLIRKTTKGIESYSRQSRCIGEMVVLEHLMIAGNFKAQNCLDILQAGKGEYCFNIVERVYPSGTIPEAFSLHLNRKYDGNIRRKKIGDIIVETNGIYIFDTSSIRVVGMDELQRKLDEVHGYLIKDIRKDRCKAMLVSLSNGSENCVAILPDSGNGAYSVFSDMDDKGILGISCLLIEDEFES